jgi:hypothetical protein
MMRFSEHLLMCWGERVATREKKTGNSKSAAHEFLNWKNTKIVNSESRNKHELEFKILNSHISTRMFVYVNTDSVRLNSMLIDAKMILNEIDVHIIWHVWK